MNVIGLLIAGASAGCLGVVLSQKTKEALKTKDALKTKETPKTKDTLCARVAKMGILTNVVGMLVWWLGMMLNDFTPYS
jgi:hypothetical protein